MPGFDPNEPRDERGRWTDAGGAIQHAASDNFHKKRILFYTPNPNLDEKQKAVEKKFIADLQENFYLREQQYLADEKLSGPNHNVIGNDNVKELSPDYSASNEARAEFAPAVHEPASAFTKAVYLDMLNKPPVSNDAVFTGGGTGAGKSTGLNRIPDLKLMADKADVVYDSNLAGEGSARARINEALATGRDANVIYVYRDIVDAFKNGVVKRTKEKGRTVPITEHVNRSIDVWPVAEKLEKDFAGNKKVTFHYIDNENGNGSAKVSTLQDIQQKAYLYSKKKQQTIKDLTDYVTEQYKQGQITQKQFKGFTTKTE